LSKAVAMVVVPGSEGNFGVLPGHALLISTVRRGILDLYSDEQTQISRRLAAEAQYNRMAGGCADAANSFSAEPCPRSPE